MNKIEATISNIETIENITIVEFNTNSHTLRMMALSLNPNYKKGVKVLLGAKTTHTALAKNLEGQISISNQLHRC